MDNDKTSQRQSLSGSSQIEVGESEIFNDDDFIPSDWDPETSSYGESLASNVYRHFYEDGKKYYLYQNVEATYPTPVDPGTLDCEELSHVCAIEMTGSQLFQSPIGELPQSIIDVGTGIGIWAMEVADKYPSAQVVGIDLEPLQQNWVPPNLRYINCDVNGPWPGGNYDLVHMRHMMPIISGLDSLLKRACEYTRPGGFVELAQIGFQARCDDGSMSPDTAIAAFFDRVHDTYARFGCNTWIGYDLDTMMGRAGLVNIQCRRFKLPLSPWAKKKKMRLIGKYMQEILYNLFQTWATKPYLGLLMSTEEMEQLVTDANAELNDLSIYVYLDHLNWFGVAGWGARDTHSKPTRAEKPHSGAPYIYTRSYEPII